MWHRHILCLSYTLAIFAIIIPFSYVVSKLFPFLTGRASWRDSILVKAISRLNQSLSGPHLPPAPLQSASSAEAIEDVQFHDIPDVPVPSRPDDTRPTPSFSGIAPVANVYAYPYDELPTFQARSPEPTRFRTQR